MRHGESRIEFLHGLRVGQIGIVVRDLQSALERYSTFWGVAPWRGYTYSTGTVRRLSYHGKPSEYAMRIALAGEAPQLELIEPLQGPSIYQDWLLRHGEGLHHLGVMVGSLQDGIQAMEEAGFVVTQSGVGYGLDGDGGYAYFNTEAVFGVILELIEIPRRRRAPDFVWPP